MSHFALARMSRSVIKFSYKMNCKGEETLALFSDFFVLMRALWNEKSFEFNPST
jgi:hypothetical protein